MNQTITDDAFVAKSEAPEAQSFRETVDSEIEAIQAETEPYDPSTPGAQLPKYVTDDFDLVPNADGVARFRPNRVAVTRVIAGAPQRMARAIDALSTEDIQLVQLLANEITSFKESLVVLDDFVATNLVSNLAQQAFQRAVRAERFRHSAKSWMSRLRQGDPHPDRLINLINMTTDTARKGAILFKALRQVDLTVREKYDRAAWDVMNQEAYRHTQQYLGDNSSTARGANENSASLALLDAC